MHSLAVFAGMCHSYRCLPNVWVVHHYTSSFTRPHALPHVNTASNKHWLLVDLDGCYANSTLFSPIVQLVAFSKSWPPLLWLYITRYSHLCLSSPWNWRIVSEAGGWYNSQRAVQVCMASQHGWLSCVHPSCVLLSLSRS